MSIPCGSRMERRSEAEKKSAQPDKTVMQRRMEVLEDKRRQSGSVQTAPVALFVTPCARLVVQINFSSVRSGDDGFFPFPCLLVRRLPSVMIVGIQSPCRAGER